MIEESAETIQQFVNLKTRFESKLKKQIIDKICDELGKDNNVTPEDLKELRADFYSEYSNLKRSVKKKQKATEEDACSEKGEEDGMNEEKQSELKKKQTDQQMREFSTFTMKELKYNLPMTTTLKERANIFKEIVRLSRSKKISLVEAKEQVYKAKSIYIIQVVDPDVNRTDANNMHEEREYNEYKGMPVYGWTDDGDALYEPTLGALVVAPEYKFAGFEWRTVLEERWLQRSFIDDDETLDTYRGN